MSTNYESSIDLQGSSWVEGYTHIQLQVWRESLE